MAGRRVALVFLGRAATMRSSQHSERYARCVRRNLIGLCNFVISIVVCTLGLLPAHGQFSAKKKDPPPPPAPTAVTLKAQVPSLTPLAESDASQVKDGLRITVEPETFHAEGSVVESIRQVPPPSKFGIVMMPAPGAIYVQHTQTPQLLIKPERLIFHVHINNQLPRVFRGSGIAVQFNIAGKVSNVDPSGYGDLVNVLIPPRSEQEVTIVGPEVASIPSPSTVGVFLYDVVTKMDQAGNVTEKQNFEWYFSYQTQVTEKDIAVQPPTAGWEVPQ